MAEHKNCKQCEKQFEITNDDLKFYKKISPTFAGQAFEIPTPNLCPLCRWQRRIAFRNERNLYKRNCNLSGKEIISMYPDNVPFPVYHITEWFSDKWDPKKFGRDYDFSKTFFEQYELLSAKVPRFHSFVDPTQSQNSEYTNQSINLKDCYLTAVATNDENCLYSRAINNSKDCCDCLRVNDCELCYECLNLTNCYNCYYLNFSGDCKDCFLSSNLRGCSNCFGCHELIQKEFYIFNKKVSKDEWNKFISNVDWSNLKNHFVESEIIRLSVPHKFAHLIKSENCLGDHLYQSSNSTNCFDSVDIENCSYCNELTLGAKDSYDFSMTGKDCELVYEAMGCGYSTNNSKFIINCRQNIYNLTYCENCFPQVNNCFGCISLRNSSYCILNKQYSKEEYDKLVPKIIQKMINDKEWGEFFPVSLSPFRYNKTLANDYFPKDKSDVEKYGMSWQEEENISFSGESYSIEAIDVYKNSQGKCNELTQQVLICKKSGRPYKITPAELSFYIKNRLPVPTLHPDERFIARFAKQNPCRLYHRKCMNKDCENEFETTYAPDRPERIYCESCYQKVII